VSSQFTVLQVTKDIISIRSDLSSAAEHAELVEKLIIIKKLIAKTKWL